MTSPSPSLPSETVDALQRALVTQHAAVWVYGLVSAFLPGSFGTAVDLGMQAHTTRRDAVMQKLASAGSTPKSAEPAYLTPQPVNNQASALAVLVVAETDSSAAWRSVLENTTDAELRRGALDALTDSAVRATKWRKAAGQTPSATALPGQQS